MDALKHRYLLLALSLFYFAEALSQEQKAFPLRQRIVFSTTTVRLDSMLKKVSQQTSLIFSYNPRKLNRDLLFHFPSGSSTVEEILKAIKEKTGLDYALAENHIILKQPKTPSPPALTSKANPNAEGLPQKKKAAFIPSPAPSAVKKDSSIANVNKVDSSKSIVKTAEELSAKESTLPNPTKVNTLSPQEKKELMKVKTDSTVQSSLQKKEKTTETKSSTQKNTPLPFQFKAGLSADETLYIGPAWQIGVPFLYAAFSYKTDFTTSLLSYGAGTSIKLNDQWRIHLFGNWGNASKSTTYSYKLNQDSLITADSVCNVKSRLTRMGITFEKKLRGNLSIELGLQYNVLTSTYTINEDSPGSSLTKVATTKSFQAIHPPYSFSSSDLTVKDWIGIQLSLFYTLSFSKRR